MENIFFCLIRILLVVSLFPSIVQIHGQILCVHLPQMKIQIKIIQCFLSEGSCDWNILVLKFGLLKIMLEKTILPKKNINESEVVGICWFYDLQWTIILFF